jgi:hypothetical protein
MTKKLLLMSTLVMLLFACSKDDKHQELSPNNQKSGQNIPFKVSISDFIKKVEVLPMPGGRVANTHGTVTRDSSLFGKVSDIYLIAYNEIGFPAINTHQRSGSSDFGIISDSLPAGDYTIVVLASSDSLNIPSYSALEAYLNPDQTFKAFPDIFYKKTSINISNTQSPSFNLTLDRLVGRLEVNILDAPAISQDSIVDVTMRYEHTIFDFLVDFTTYRETPEYFPIKRRSQNLFSDFIMNTKTEVTVTISYIDRISGQRLKKVIEHVTMERNKSTILTGKLYPTSNPDDGKTDFNLGLNNTWKPEKVVHF